MLNNIETVKIRLYPRLHISLIGMHTSGYRINGGVGFSIDRPFLQVTCTPAANFEVADSRSQPLSVEACIRLQAIIEEQQRELLLEKSIYVSIEGDLLSNYGFGSGTAIRLACLESLFLLNNKHYTRKELVQASGRGGTSGIGINTYFDGGFVIDIGHRTTNSEVKPSNAVENLHRVPLQLVSHPFPPFEIGICIPKFISRLTQEQESEFFKRTIPIPTTEVHKILYEVIYGLYPAVIESDMLIFAESINNIQSCHWKKSEIMNYGSDIQEIIDDLKMLGATAAGMSSMGPCIYFVSPNINDTLEKATTKYGCDRFVIFKTTPRNTGRDLSYA